MLELATAKAIHASKEYWSATVVTSSAYRNLDNFAIVSVFSGQPPPMIMSGGATVPFDWSGVKR